MVCVIRVSPLSHDFKRANYTKHGIRSQLNLVTLYASNSKSYDHIIFLSIGNYFWYHLMNDLGQHNRYLSEKT